MQDLRQGNYTVYELARTRRGNGRRSFYAYQVRIKSQSCRELTNAFMGRVSAIIYFRALQCGVSAKIYAGIDNTIVVLTMNNALVIRPERLVRSQL